MLEIIVMKLDGPNIMVSSVSLTRDIPPGLASEIMHRSTAYIGSGGNGFRCLKGNKCGNTLLRNEQNNLFSYQLTSLDSAWPIFCIRVFANTIHAHAYRQELSLPNVPHGVYMCIKGHATKRSRRLFYELL